MIFSVSSPGRARIVISADPFVAVVGEVFDTTGINTFSHALIEALMAKMRSVGANGGESGDCARDVYEGLAILVNMQRI